MTEEVTQPEVVEEKVFLDLDEAQYSTVAYLSSAGAQMARYIGSEELKQDMQNMLESGNYTTLNEALAWIRGSRNNITKLAGAATFALSLLAQVEDLVIDRIVAEQLPAQTEETK